MTGVSSELPWRDISASSSRQHQGDVSFIPPANASSFSHAISSRSRYSSELPMNDTLVNTYTDEEAHYALHSASSKQLPPLDFSAEGLTQDQSTEGCSHESSFFDEDSQAVELWPSTSAEDSNVNFFKQPSVARSTEDQSMEGCSHESSSSDEASQAVGLWPSTSANENSNANFFKQPSAARSAEKLCEASRQEESNCTSEEREVPDDVKREILKEKHKDVAILSCNSEAMGGPTHVYLIGTAHVSEESCREVRAIISLMRPEVVFVELCQKRVFILRRRPIVVPTISDLLASWKENRTNMLGLLYSWFVGKVAAELHILPGSEFQAAYEEAQNWGAKVILGDRDIEVTLRRTWGKMSMWHKTKFIALIVLHAFCLPKADQLNELIEKLKDNDMITVAFEELGKTFPTLLETLIDERDMFMAAVLQKLGEDTSSIVAVVGKGHIAGIRKYWGQAINTQHLLEIPPTQPIWTITFKLFLLAALVALTSIILYVYYR